MDTPDTDEHIALPPGLRTEMDNAFIKPDHEFQGKKLFAYSEGVRLLLSSLSGGTISNDFWLLILLLLLTDLQEIFDGVVKESGITRPLIEAERDAFTEAAVAEILSRIGDKPDLYRSRVFTLANKLKRESKGLDLGMTRDGKRKMTLVDKAVDLALEVYNEAEMSETIPADAPAEGTPPK